MGIEARAAETVTVPCSKGGRGGQNQERLSQRLSRAKGLRNRGGGGDGCRECRDMAILGCDVKRKTSERDEGEISEVARCEEG